MTSRPDLSLPVPTQRNTESSRGALGRAAAGSLMSDLRVVFQLPDGAEEPLQSGGTRGLGGWTASANVFATGKSQVQNTRLGSGCSSEGCASDLLSTPVGGGGVGVGRWMTTGSGPGSSLVCHGLAAWHWASHPLSPACFTATEGKGGEHEEKEGRTEWTLAFRRLGPPLHPALGLPLLLPLLPWRVEAGRSKG